MKLPDYEPRNTNTVKIPKLEAILNLIRILSDKKGTGGSLKHASRFLKNMIWILLSLPKGNIIQLQVIRTTYCPITFNSKGQRAI